MAVGLGGQSQAVGRVRRVVRGWPGCPAFGLRAAHAGGRGAGLPRVPSSSTQAPSIPPWALVLLPNHYPRHTPLRLLMSLK